MIAKTYYFWLHWRAKKIRAFLDGSSHQCLVKKVSPFSWKVCKINFQHHNLRQALFCLHRNFQTEWPMYFFKYLFEKKGKNFLYPFKLSACNFDVPDLTIKCPNWACFGFLMQSDYSWSRSTQKICMWKHCLQKLWNMLILFENVYEKWALFSAIGSTNLRK